MSGTVAERDPLKGVGGDGRPLDNLRQRAARGTGVNAVYAIGINFLGFVKGVVVAALLTTAAYGLWSLLAVTVVTLLWLAQVGVNDKYLQQDHPDQKVAFQLAFTLQFMLAMLLTFVIVAGVTVASLVYDRPGLLAPGLVLALGMPATALHAPQWVFYRRMNFVKQRLLQAVDPVTSFLVVVPLAAAGLGIWALVIATVASNWIAAAVALKVSPYPVRFRYERGTLREYATFSWPLLLNSASAVATAQIPIFFVNGDLGLAAVGAIGLASQIALFTSRVDEIVSHALYPAICAVKDKPDLQFESFSKSNRLALIWAVPGGVGIALFADEIVHYVLGDKWDFAVPLIAVMALCAAMSQIAFNWHLYFQARNSTRPIAVHGILYAAVFVGLGVPLLLAHGLDGYAAAALAATVVSLLVRVAFLTRLFPSFRMLAHAGRAILPTVPAAAAVLGLRALGVDGDTAGATIALIAAFLLIVCLATWALERSLLREAIGYLRPRAPAAAA